jgi:PPK2 family polyphosphate:nucleotide phosphotransferase
MKRYRVKPGTKVDLREWDPEETNEFKGHKADGIKALKPLTIRLEELQELLYAEGKHKILIVLQAMDAGGKDGTIRHVFDGVNPQGVKVASFKAPTDHELARDYLWRVHWHVPAKGEMTIFNRSHYEDVLVVRVKNLVPHNMWRRRYDQINDFERLLSEEGTTVLKFYLHISKQEQKQRLQARLGESEKHWKFSTADLKERGRWSEYVKAYEAVLSKTSTKWAPWYVIPANRKWYRNLVISRILVETLEGLDMSYPAPERGLDKVVVD